MEDAKQLSTPRSSFEEFLEASLEATLQLRVLIETAQDAQNGLWLFVTLHPKLKLSKDASGFVAVRLSCKAAGDLQRIFMTQHIQIGSIPHGFWLHLLDQIRKILAGAESSASANLFELKASKESRDKLFSETSDVEVPIEVLESRTQGKKSGEWDQDVLESKSERLMSRYQRLKSEDLHVPMLRRFQFFNLAELVGLDFSDIETAVAREPENLSFQFLKARWFVEREPNPEQVVEMLSDALKNLSDQISDPESLKGLRDVPLEILGDAWVAENADRAQVCYEEVLKQRGYSEGLVDKLLQICRTLVDHEGELKYLKKKLAAHRAKEARQDLLTQIAKVYLEQLQNPQEAYKAAEEAMNIFAWSETTIHLMARILSNLGRPRDAAEFLIGKIEDLTERGEATGVLNDLLQSVLKTQINRPDLLIQPSATAASSPDLPAPPVAQEEGSSEHEITENEIESSLQALETRTDIAEGIFTRTISSLLGRKDETRIREYLQQLCEGEIPLERLSYYFDIFFDLCQNSPEISYGLIDYGLQRLFDIGLDYSTLYLKAVRLLLPSQRNDLLVPYVSGLIAMRQIPPLDDAQIVEILEGHDFTLGLFYELKAQISEDAAEAKNLARKAIEKFQNTVGAETAIRKLEDSYHLIEPAQLPVSEEVPSISDNAPPESIPMVSLSMAPIIPFVPETVEPKIEEEKVEQPPLESLSIQLPPLSEAEMPQMEIAISDLGPISEVDDSAVPEPYVPSWAKESVEKNSISEEHSPLSDSQLQAIPGIKVVKEEDLDAQAAIAAPVQPEVSGEEVPSMDWKIRMPGENNAQATLEAPKADPVLEVSAEESQLLMPELKLKSLDSPAPAPAPETPAPEAHVPEAAASEAPSDLGPIILIKSDPAPTETVSEAPAPVLEVPATEAAPLAAEMPASEMEVPAMKLELAKPHAANETPAPEPVAETQSAAKPANEFGPSPTFNEEKTAVLSTSENRAAGEVAGESSEKLQTYDPATISEVDWRSAVKLKNVPPNAAQIISQQAFVSEIEKHVAMQLMALGTGDFKVLEKWHMRVWRHNNEWLYPIQGRDRFPAGTSSKILESNLAQVLSLCERVLIGTFLEKFSIGGLAKKLNAPKAALLQMMRPIGFDDPWVQSTALGIIANRIQKSKYTLVHLPGMTKEVFFDLDKRLIIFDREYFNQNPMTILFHKVLIGLWQLKLGYFAAVNLDVANETAPFLEAVKNYFASDFMTKLKARAGISNVGVGKFLHLVPQDALKEHLRGVSEINIEQIATLVSAMDAQAMKMDMAETLDLIGIFESKLGQDLISTQKLKAGKIFALPNWSFELLKFATKLKV